MDLTQLTLTNKEASILCSITSLGIKTMMEVGPEGIKHTRELCITATILWPEEVESLVKKLQIMSNLLKENHEKEMEDSRVKKV